MAEIQPWWTNFGTGDKILPKVSKSKLCLIGIIIICCLTNWKLSSNFKLVRNLESFLKNFCYREFWRQQTQIHCWFQRYSVSVLFTFCLLAIFPLKKHWKTLKKEEGKFSKKWILLQALSKEYAKVKIN